MAKKAKQYFGAESKKSARKPAKRTYKRRALKAEALVNVQIPASLAFQLGQLVAVMA